MLAELDMLPPELVVEGPVPVLTSVPSVDCPAESAEDVPAAVEELENVAGGDWFCTSPELETAAEELGESGGEPLLADEVVTGDVG